VIGMGMGIEYPLNLQVFLANPRQNFVSRNMGSTPAGIIKIQDGINNGARATFGLFDQIAGGERGFIKKAFNNGFHTLAPHLDHIRIFNYSNSIVNMVASPQAVANEQLNLSAQQASDQ
jgi:hypothetical protein